MKKQVGNFTTMYTKRVKLLFFALSAFFFIHALRDYLQIKGVKNWFTEVGHFWNAPQYEKYSMGVCIILGVLFFYLAYNFES
jgi:hypothetical protein